MHAIYQKDTIHRWVATPRLIREWLNHFYHKLEEISMVCKDGSIIFKSFIDEAVAREGMKYILKFVINLLSLYLIYLKIYY